MKLQVFVAAFAILISTANHTSALTDTPTAASQSGYPQVSVLPGRLLIRLGFEQNHNMFDLLNLV